MGLRQFIADLRRPKAHPTTGDLLNPSERFSWFVQKGMRRWSFVAAYVAGSITWWQLQGAFHGGLRGWLHDPTLAHWNVCASLAALLIESSVGIVVIRQMVRDRTTIKAELEELKATHEEVLGIAAAIREQADHIIEHSPDIPPMEPA